MIATSSITLGYLAYLRRKWALPFRLFARMVTTEQKVLAALILVQFAGTLSFGAVRPQSTHAVWEGSVVDVNGKPVQGVLITISQGSYSTQGETEWFALGFPKASGMAVWYDPTVVKTHYINTHFAKTDHRGHFEFRNVSPGRYTLSVRGMKKYYGDFRTSEQDLVPDKKLLARYSFPLVDQVVFEGGKQAMKPIVLAPN